MSSEWLKVSGKVCVAAGCQTFQSMLRPPDIPFCRDSIVHAGGPVVSELVVSECELAVTEFWLYRNSSISLLKRFDCTAARFVPSKAAVLMGSYGLLFGLLFGLSSPATDRYRSRLSDRQPPESDLRADCEPVI